MNVGFPLGLFSLTCTSTTYYKNYMYKQLYK